MNSQVRAALPTSLREHMDSLPKEELRSALRALKAQSDLTGWRSASAAGEAALAATGRLDEATLYIVAASDGRGMVEYDEPVDLTVYDGALGRGRS